MRRGHAGHKLVHLVGGQLAETRTILDHVVQVELFQPFELRRLPEFQEVDLQSCFLRSKVAIGSQPALHTHAHAGKGLAIELKIGHHGGIGVARQFPPGLVAQRERDRMNGLKREHSRRVGFGAPRIPSGVLGGIAGERLIDGVPGVAGGRGVGPTQADRSGGDAG